MNTDDPAVMAWSLVALGALTTLLTVFALVVLRNIYRQFKFELEYLKHPKLVPYDEIAVCQDTHKWIETQLVLRGLPPGRYQVCMTCGAISGNDQVKVSQEVLDQMQEALKLGEEKEKARREISERINAIADYRVDEYIEHNFSHSEALRAKLKALVTYAFQAQSEAQEKVLEEEMAQADLTKRYAEWPDKIKGNA